MTGATHIAIALSVGIMAGVEPYHLPLIAFGAVIPDIDTPRSTVGRIFFPISMPISNWLGHRGAVHSFWLWGICAVLGILWGPLLFVGVGGILHILADCGTVSGVRAMSPWSTKLFVVFKREWRIKTGSNAELAILLVFGMFAWGSHHITATGGISAFIGHLTGSPKIMYEEYINKGLEICMVEGKFRWNNGKTELVTWQIIGTEGTGMAFVNGDHITRSPLEGKLLSARLKPTGIFYESVNIKGWYVAGTECYFMSKGKWFHAKVNDLVYGNVIGTNLSIKENNDELFTLNVERH
jgi:membrane-bound metal-dependent hydrolase YbcI (DUF457 family)